MSAPQEFDEIAVLEKTRTSFQLRQTDLCDWLFRPGGAIELILLWEPHTHDLTTVQANDIIDELHRLLKRKAFQRSQARLRELSGVVLATVLRRPQFGDTNGVKKLCRLGKAANVATEFARLKPHLEAAYSEPGARVRIRFSGRRRGEWPYAPEFDFADETGRFLDIPMETPQPVVRSEFNEAACAVYIAAHLRKSNGHVAIYSRTGGRLLGQVALAEAGCDPACRGSLSVSLLDPACAGAERGTIEHALRRLQDWKSAGSAPVDVVCHRDDGFRMTVVVLPGGDLLVCGDRSDKFLELRVGDSLYEDLKALIPVDQSPRRVPSDS
jgi:hypothetical protein